jgi:hypothetical protein
LEQTKIKFESKFYNKNVMLSQNSSLNQNYYLMFQVITEWTLHAEQEEYTLEAIEWTHLVKINSETFLQKNN